MTITRSIGAAERSLQALLALHLQKDQLSFPQWIVLVFLDGGDGVKKDAVVAGLVGGRIVTQQDADEIIAGLEGRGLIEAVLSGSDTLLRQTAMGRRVFDPLKARIDATIRTLIETVGEDDIAQTQRTLNVIAQRAKTLLPASDQQA